jgi:transketolase
MTVGTTPDTGRPASQTTESLDELCVTTIRTLAMDAVQAANSGHPGTPMALAPVAYTLWQQFLRFDPDDPIWPNRDRFVLSAGHASTLLYALLHLAGVKAVNPAYERLGELSVPLDDLKRFRQLDSRCPGHPEYRWTSGVETTTGPLGQGVATTVGMAIAGLWQATYFNRPGYDVFDYDVYALCGDGDLMEGISAEAASLAGHLSSPTSAGSTTTTASRSRATPRWPSPRTWPRASSGRAGTSRAWATPTTARCSPAPSRRSGARSNARR